MDLYKGKGYDLQYFVEIARQKMDKKEPVVITATDGTYKGYVVSAGHDIISVSDKGKIVHVEVEKILDIA